MIAVLSEVTTQHGDIEMIDHTATIEWTRSGSDFKDNQYSRAHTWRFDGGLTVPASSSPHVVRIPLSNPANVDPEEAFVAALSSCHMLWFLSLAATHGYIVECYTDAAEGRMAKNSDGKQWVSRVVLRPDIVFTGAKAPNEADVQALHKAAHAECYLANSVKSVVEITGVWHHQI
jgi:organic hydroperoxide reductase OsmC/OhrA